ncbi:MAG: FimB/Mfa2 family fimbrial subunit [Candidatus Limisoma sp.]|nr:FimB/Mfa2 family fimbrial subunit [Candidatus Limisoma sp.]MDY6105744.1 FimB/Mfa2 family fimbrial subunit [Candidatus Limisoma sp.]
MRLKSLYSPKFAVKAIVALTATLGCFSCNSVIDDGVANSCGVDVYFRYDYNMEAANSFTNKVDGVTLLVFDEAGNFVEKREESGEALRDENYKMHLDLHNKAKYTFVVYGGVACADKSFDLMPFERRSNVNLDELGAQMHTEAMEQKQSLHPLYYGKVNVEVEDYELQKVYVPLVKDTNNIRVVLQQINGEVISDKDFQCYITDDNTYMNNDNAIVPQGTVTYRPWTQGQSVIEDASWRDESLDIDDGPVTAAYYELSTGRLMASDGINQGLNPTARLVVRSVEKDREVINIPLVKYLLLLKSALYDDITKLNSLVDPRWKDNMIYSAEPNQNFLDRMSEWSIVFFLDSNNRWVNVYIIVNDWVVRINDAEL